MLLYHCALTFYAAALAAANFADVLTIKYAINDMPPIKANAGSLMIHTVGRNNELMHGQSFATEGYIVWMCD